MGESLVRRFWKKVSKTKGCWLWTGHTIRGGYGVMRYTSSNRATTAHRISYEIHVGPIPDGMFVLHRCDVPACVNPAHLFLGTQFDNMRDMVAKGRHYSRTHPETMARGRRNGRYTKPESTLRGDQHPAAKLTSALVLEARAAHAAGESTAEIAGRLGFKFRTIQAAIRRENWTHI